MEKSNRECAESILMRPEVPETELSAIAWAILALADAVEKATPSWHETELKVYDQRYDAMIHDLRQKDAEIERLKESLSYAIIHRSPKP